MKILKFGAIWCTECLVMRPMWDAIEKQFPNLVTEYYDADEHPEVLEKYKIKDIPSFIFLDNDSKVVDTLKGAQNKEDLINKVDKFLNS